MLDASDFRIELLKDMAESWNRSWFNGQKGRKFSTNRVETTHLNQESK